MSVEHCVIRVGPATVADLRREPERLAALVDGYYARLLDQAAERDWVDGRELYRGRSAPGVSALRMLHVDEFTTALLVDFMAEAPSPVFDGLIGWNTATLLDRLHYGHGSVYAYEPPAVAAVAARLAACPAELLAARFQANAAQFRAAAAGFFADDDAILAHQKRFMAFLAQLYREAARDGDAVLLLTL